MVKRWFAVFLLIPTISFAQEPLTLDKAVDVALERNHALIGARHDLESAKWGQLNAVTNFLPKVDVGGSYTQVDPETDRRANASVDFIKQSAGMFGIPPSLLSEIRPFVYRQTYATEIDVVQPIYNGGAEILGYKSADALYTKSQYSLIDTQQDVIARVKTAYFNVLKMQELVALAAESSDRTRRYLEMTQRRAALGSRTQTDVLRWQVQLSADEGNQITAENGLAMMRLQLNEAMGVDLQSSYILDAPALTDSLVASLATGGRPAIRLASFPPDDQPQPLTIEGLSQLPSLHVMEENLHLADLNVSKSLVNFQPRVNAAFQYGWEKNNTIGLDGYRPWAFALTVSFPIFSSFSDYTKLEQAQADYQRTSEQVESFKSGLLMEATNAQLLLRSATMRIQTAQKGLQQAKEVLSAVTHRYETGGASNVDMIDVQTAYTAARTNYITAVYDYAIADVEYARATGALSR